MPARDRQDQTIKYLKLLAREFPNEQAVFTEIINLQAILNLPKGTEHFMSDLHGEYEAFLHILNNCSGVIREHVDEDFGDTLSDEEKSDLCTLVYYPRERIELMRKARQDSPTWYKRMLDQLLVVTRRLSSRYTRSKVRRAIPHDFAYIIDELLHTHPDENNYRVRYHERIIDSILETGSTEDFISSLAELIKVLAVDHIHLVGDIFDRGGGAAKIMDRLLRCEHQRTDIQWGNHDILWMGAAAGNMGSIANVIRMCLRYGNLATLEDGYGINLLPLATFAMETYANDPCELFLPKTGGSDGTFDEKTIRLISQMQKAMTVIQFKLEGEIIRRRPEFQMDDRLLLHRMDLKKGTIRLANGKEYPLRDTFWPTIDPKDPYRLSIEEEDLMQRMLHSFKSSEKLHKHVRCLFRHGSMYTVCNSNLLFHASVPLNEDGTLKEICVDGVYYKGKALLDRVDQLVRTAYFETEETPEQQFAMDYVWYLWCGADSPLFDKSRMATFERCFIEDKETHKEEKGYYYTLRTEEKICDMLLDEFGVTGQHRHIINGHVPVRSIKGENPIKANGKLLVIDGGFSKAYHTETGIAGYTLVYHSRGFQLVQHEPFESTAKAIEEGLDIRSTTIVVELSSHRQMVKDTDKGAELQMQIRDLEKLLYAYRNGFIQEREREPRYYYRG